MNKDSFNRLPPDIQNIVLEVAKEGPWARIRQEEGDATGLEIMKAAGVQFINAPKAELDKVREVAKAEVWNKWAADYEKKGLPGKKMLAKWIELSEKYIP